MTCCDVLSSCADSDSDIKSIKPIRVAGPGSGGLASRSRFRVLPLASFLSFPGHCACYQAAGVTAQAVKFKLPPVKCTASGDHDTADWEFEWHSALENYSSALASDQVMMNPSPPSGRGRPGGEPELPVEADNLIMTS